MVDPTTKKTPEKKPVTDKAGGTQSTSNEFGQVNKPQTAPKIAPAQNQGQGQSESTTERVHMSEPYEEIKDKARTFAQSFRDAVPENFSRDLEDRLSQMPPAGFLGIALGAMGVSAILALANERKGWSNFFGNWVPSLLFLTLYTKLIKLEQSVQKQQSSAPTMH